MKILNEGHDNDSYLKIHNHHADFKNICVRCRDPELEPRGKAVWSNVIPEAGALNFPMLQRSFCFLIIL